MNVPAYILAAARPAHALLTARSAFVSVSRPLAARVSAPRRIHQVRASLPDATDLPTEQPSEQPASQAIDSPFPATPIEDAPAAQAPAEAVAPETIASVAAAAAPDANADANAISTEDKRKRRRPRKREVTLPLEDIEVGMELEGIVKSVMDYGAFVGEMGTPTDGLLHVSQLASGFVEKVSDVVRVGDKVTVRVLGVDMEKGNFSLTMKTADELAESRGGRGDSGGSKDSRRDSMNKKWDEFKYDQQVFVNAKVTSITDFGAFCQLVDDDGELLKSAPTEGLVHISEISEERVNKVSDVLKVGQAVKVRVTNTDHKRNRISLSLKQFSDRGEDESMDLVKDMETANSTQPAFKSVFELAFERAKAPGNQ